MESVVSLETGRGQRLSTQMISSRNCRVTLSKETSSMLKNSGIRRRLMIAVLIIIPTISLFVADSKLRQLTDKRIRYFQSLAFSAAESEVEISSFEELKKVSFVASNLDLYKKLYFGWPFKTPDILVFQRDGNVCVTEDASYPQSLFKSAKIVQKIKKIYIQQ